MFNWKAFIFNVFYYFAYKEYNKSLIMFFLLFVSNPLILVTIYLFLNYYGFKFDEFDTNLFNLQIFIYISIMLYCGLNAHKDCKKTNFSYKNLFLDFILLIVVTIIIFGLMLYGYTILNDYGIYFYI